MKVKRTLIYPFEQPAPYTSSRLSLLKVAAEWLETTMQALKDAKQSKAAETSSSALPDCVHERLLRNCSYRPALLQLRKFSPKRQRLSLSMNPYRADSHHW